MQNFYDLGLEVTLNAGNLLKDGFGSVFEIQNKEGKNNLVTEYDFKAEELIISSIKNVFPDHSFLAEESGKEHHFEGSEYRWVIDPLDGTVNFAHNIPIFCVSIAMEYKGEVQFGFIFNPITNELFTAQKGKGSYFNNKKINVSNTSDFEKSFLVTGFPYNINENPDNCLQHFTDIISYGMPIRRLGSAAIDLAYVACGRFDAFWEVSLNPWDVAAGLIIVQEAGGKVTNYQGDDFTLKDKSLIASNNIIHNELIKVVNRK